MTETESPSLLPESAKIHQIHVDDVVEIWTNKSLKFGIVTDIQEKTIHALTVSQDSEASLVKASSDEVVCVWPEEFRLNDIELEKALKAAHNLIRTSTPRSLSLDKLFVHLGMFSKKNASSCMTSVQIAEFLKGDQDHACLQNPNVTTQVAMIYSAMLVSSDTIRFRRANALKGWRAVPKSVASSRAYETFEELCKQAVDDVKQHKKSSIMWSADHMEILRQLEICVVSGSAFPKFLRNIMKSLGYEDSKQGAQELLVAIGFWSSNSSGLSSAAAESSSSSSSSSTSNSPSANSSSTTRNWAFSDEVLEAARQARDKLFAERTQLTDPNHPVSLDFLDFRRNDVLCIDDSTASFRDDAIHFHRMVYKKRDCIEVNVHVADVDQAVPYDSVLDKIARDRGQSIYLPAGPLHMLPPMCMEAISFNEKQAAEAVTVRMIVDLATGRVLDHTVCRSIVPPVRVMTFKKAQDEYETLGDNADENLGLLMEASNAIASFDGFQRRKHRSDYMSVREDNKTSSSAASSSSVRKYEFSDMHDAVDVVLNTAGQFIRRFAKYFEVYLPERRGSEFFALRCGTAPMRKYMDLAVQRQLKAIINEEEPFTKEEMVELNRWLEKRLVESKKIVQEQRQRVLFENLANHCSQVGAGGAILKASIVDEKGGKLRVRLKETGLTATVQGSASLVLSRKEYMEQNKEIQVVVKQVDVTRQRIVVELLDQE
eukprot:CAMPEP_0184696838 /NCGR_PEP_ID=MMETSP0313-20130426/4008_1 /TAXON_ID=2792 /ORGANISM="Porphyridium aerugineum, Strain SAG 1380-2" /LENGTH=713 /DNA_ID=CAMNT_0027155553 /DNA_START=145 /DNA_END=2286 /DNA_ORIENTATION=+